MRQGAINGFELLVLAVGALAVSATAVVWLGAAFAAVLAGGSFSGSPADALAAAVALPSHLQEPRAAWPEGAATRLPGPLLYWAATALVALATATVLGVAIRWWEGARVGTAPRRPLGVDSRARFARRSDLRPLLVRRACAGRFVVGRFGRRLVATETPRGRRRGRQGDRGAVALIGPSRSGKTTAAVAGILEWEGPAILSSVKADLLGTTSSHRSQVGDVAIYDPTGTTGRSSARWSPLRDARSILGSQRAARSLCDAAPRGGVEGGLDFWLAQAEILLSGLLFVAAHSGRDMAAVCEWVMQQDRPTEAGNGEVRDLLEPLLSCGDALVEGDAVQASQSLGSVWEMEERTRSSVYATAQTVVWPWADPGVALAARGDSLDLGWLLSKPNTVYLCAPIEDQHRLAPAFGGLLNDLIKQIYLRVAATGTPLDPPLLIVIDEAGNTPLRQLPEYASTLAGLGVLFVTIWQSVAQLQAAYHRQADTILTNHLTKVFYAGLSDPASLRYVNDVLGDAEIETRSHTDGTDSRRSQQLSTARQPLAPAHALRQMRPGDALLVHGTLPPAHVRTRPWWRDRRLAAMAASSSAPIQSSREQEGSPR